MNNTRMDRLYNRLEKSEGFKLLVAVFLFGLIMTSIVVGIRWSAQRQADSINQMTGSTSVTAEDVLLNGDKIIVLPK